MKFHLRNLKNLHGRLGTISDVERLREFKMDTPNIVFYTNGGSIPHLTHDVLQMLTKDVLPLQFPLDNMYHASEVIEKSETPFHSFVCLPEYLSYCIVQDPTITKRLFNNRNNAATIWSRNGKRFIAAEEYMKLMEVYEPDMYVSLYEGDTSITSTRKRISNSAHTTNRAFKYCYDYHISSPVLSKKGFIAAIEGGYDLTTREKCAQYLSEFPVLGYLIDGLFLDGKSIHKIPFSSVENIISHTVKHLPEERLRIVHGAWEPHLILKMVKLGVDLFDTSFPYLNTEKGCALTFNFNIDNLFDDNVKLFENRQCKTEFEHVCENEVAEVNESEILNTASCDDEGSGDNIKIKNIPDVTNSSESIKNESEEKDDYVSPYSISLYESKYFDDFTPLLENCNCLSCRKYTKAYIHHLLLTKEMLAWVLLMIHNLHHYMGFFCRIREQLDKIEQKPVN